MPARLVVADSPQTRVNKPSCVPLRRRCAGDESATALQVCTDAVQRAHHRMTESWLKRGEGAPISFGDFVDGVSPSSRGIRFPGESTSQAQHVADDFPDCDGGRGMQRLRLSCDVGSNAENDYAMTGLRNAVFL